METNIDIEYSVNYDSEAIMPYIGEYIGE